jgi:disulfide bond formation protein DsbB
MAIFLFIVIALIIWSLRLLQRAIKLRDSSLILASSLVGVSAAGVVVVYLLMDGCMSFFSSAHLSQTQMDMSIPAVLYETDPVHKVVSAEYQVSQLVSKP